MLRDRRIAAGMSQQKLADAAGLHRMTIQKWERFGVSRAEARMLRAAARVLGCTVDELLDEEEGRQDG